MSDSKVVQLSDYSTTLGSAGGEKLQSGSPSFSQIRDVEDGARGRGARKRDRVTGLYPDLEETTPTLYNALSTLRGLLLLAKSAETHFNESEYILADDLTGKLISELPRVFAAVSEFDSMGQLTVTLFHCLRSQKGMPLSQRQMAAVVDVLTQLCEAPFMNQDETMVLIDMLDDAEFDVVPRFVEPLIEVLTDEGFY